MKKRPQEPKRPMGGTLTRTVFPSGGGMGSIKFEGAGAHSKPTGGRAEGATGQRGKIIDAQSKAKNLAIKYKAKRSK